MKNSFANVANGGNILTRNFGGKIAGVADPYVSGYPFIRFAKLPDALPDYCSEFTTNSQIINVLSAANMSVTPPGGTLNRIEFPGLGGLKWGVPGNVDYGTSVSLKFLEFNGSPILDIMHGWTKLIRDYRTGTTNLQESEDGSGYSQKTYTALLYYWTTSPDPNFIEYYACYDGIFPMKDPQDLYSGDIENVARLDVEIEFNVNYIWHEDWVKTKCQTFASDVYGSKRVVEGYGESSAT